MVEIKEETVADTPTKMETDQESSEECEGDDDTKPNDDTPFDPEGYLKMKIKLSDDSEVFLFSYGPKCKESGESRPLNCHLCRVGSLKEDLKKGHLQSKLHERNLKRKMKPERFNRPYRQFCGLNDEGKLMQFEINPGENIPEVTDEHKDRIFIKEAQYVRPVGEDLKELKDEKLHQYNSKMPLLGLGYIFKMKTGNQIIYHCALCRMKIKGEPFQHVAASTHQASYIIKHFPNLYTTVQEGLKEIKNEPAREQCIRNIFRYLYRKIENKKKKVRVNLIDFEYFQKNREEVITKCNELKHFDEESLKFNKKEIDALIRKAVKGIEFIKPDLRSLAKPELGERATIPIVLANQKQVGNQQQGGNQRQRQQGRDEPPMKMRRSDLGGSNPENWAAYSLMRGNILDEINAEYKRYEQNPRSHPQYDYEWKLFWRERCKELKRDKIDPRYHDFETEWTPYWIQRLRQFYGKDLANRKRELKRVLNLPFGRSPSPIRQANQQMQPEPMQWQPQPQPMFGAPNMNQDRPMPIFTEDTPIVSSEPLSVISVMRLLSALEDQLGSLGPKAVQLLSRAVLCEKDSGNTNDLLMDNDYYVFFATVKEKFRGQLQANVIDPGKLKAVQHCGNEISTILEIMETALAKERERKRKEEERQKRLQQQQQRQQQQKQRQEQQQQQQQQKLQQQKIQAQSLLDTFSDSLALNPLAGGNRVDPFVVAGGNKGNQQGSGSGNNTPQNQGAGTGRNRGGRKRNAGGDVASNRNDAGNIWVRSSGGAAGNDFGNSDNFGGRNFSGGNDNSGRNFSGGNDNSGRNFGGGNDNLGRNFGGGNNNNSGRNFGGGNDNNSGRNFGSGGNDNSGRNFGGGNDNSGRNFGGGNDNAGRNFGSGNDNSGRSFGGGNDNSGRNFASSNDNFGRNFGSGDDNTGRNFGGGNDNSGRNFSSGGGGNNSGRNFSSGKGNNTGRNFSSGNLGSRNEGGNFGSGTLSSRNDGNFGGGNNQNDNFNRNFAGGNDRSGGGTGRGNFGSGNDMGRNFSSGGNNDNFNRSSGGGGGGNNDSFGRSFGSGGGNNSYGAGNLSGGGGNNSGRNFGGGGGSGNNNRSNFGGNSSSRGNFGGNMGSSNRSLDNNQRDAAGNLFSRRNDDFGGGNTSGNLGGGSFNLGQSSNFGRMMGFNSNY